MSTVDFSRIDEAVDATAAVIAANVAGIKAVYGVGSGKVSIPTGGIMAGMIVPEFPGTPVEPFTHVSDVPTAPTLNWYSANVLEIVWLVPFRLYLSAVQISLRKQSMAFLPLYIAAISQDMKLNVAGNDPIVPGGSVRIQSWGIFNAEQHGFDGVGGIFQVVERLDSGNQAQR